MVVLILENVFKSGRQDVYFIVSFANSRLEYDAALDPV